VGRERGRRASGRRSTRSSSPSTWCRTKRPAPCQRAGRGKSGRYKSSYRVSEDLKPPWKGCSSPKSARKSWAPPGCRSVPHQPGRLDRRLPRDAGTIRREAKCGFASFARTRSSATTVGITEREKDDAREVREGLECGIKLPASTTSRKGTCWKRTDRGNRADAVDQESGDRDQESDAHLPDL